MTDVSPAIGQPDHDVRRRRLRLRIGFLVLTVVSALVLAAVGTSRLYVNHTVAQLQAAGNNVVVLPPGVAKVKGKGHLTAKPKTGQPFTVLILGTDSRVGTGTEYGDDSDACGCSDTIILARVNPVTDKVSLLSIPRDTRVLVTGSNVTTKINSAYGRGPDNSVDTIQTALGIPINHWVVLDLAGFKSIVDAIGGIKLDFPYPVMDKNAGLFVTTAGCQKVNGDTALAISRSRELKYLDPKTGKYVFDPTYEYGRARREQILMKVIAAHTVKRSLSNPITAANVISTFTSNNRLAVDPQVSSSELVDLVGDFASFNAATMQSFTLPTFTKRLPAPGYPAGLDFEILEQSEDIATIQAWYNATAATPKPAASPTLTPTTTSTAATGGTPTTTTTTTSAAKTTTPVVAPTTTAAAAGASPTATATISPNEPHPYDPRPCS